MYYLFSIVSQLEEEDEARVTINGTNKMLNCFLKLEDCNAVDVTAACTARCPVYRILL